ncbi:hypothetical protein RE943_27010 [Prescottella equi]|nr:hypothetical protein RE943_27010 [Prescottella equi]
MFPSHGHAVSPSPTPCAARPINRTGNGTGSAVSAPPAATIVSVQITTARRRGPDPSRLRIGVLTAPESSGTVNVHCAAARET